MELFLNKLPCDLLSIVIFLPLCGAFLVLLTKTDFQAKVIGLVATLLNFGNLLVITLSL